MSETASPEQPLTLEELAEEVRKAKTEAKDAKQMASNAQDRLLDVREEANKKDQRIAELEQEVASLEDELGTLRDRTGLLETVKRGSSMKIDERAAVLIQTLYNQAWRNKQSNANTNPTASMDYNAAEGALGGSVDRSNIYRTFDKAESLIDNSDVLEYIKEGHGSSKNTRLVLDLGSGDLPETVAGQSISQPGGV